MNRIFLGISIYFTFVALFVAKAQVATNQFLDPLFGKSGIAVFDSSGWEGAWDAVVQKDGKIVVAGWRQKKWEGTTDVVLIRFKPDGSLDSSFNSRSFITLGENTWEGAYALALQNDDAILVAGRAFTNGSWDFLLFKCDANGNIDSSFGNDGFVVRDVTEDDRAFAIDIQNDGKIVLAGLSTVNDWDFAVLRFNIDGSADSTFGNNGIVIKDINGGQDAAFSVRTQSDGKIIAGGWSYGPNNYDFTLIRYNNDGSLDNSFGVNGVVITDLFGSYNSAHSVDIQKDGKYVLAGYTYYPDKQGYDLVAVRYNNDGSIDPTFGNNGIVIINHPLGNTFAWKVKVQPDQKIIISGNIAHNSRKNIFVVRLNSDGSLDESFGENGYAIIKIYDIDEEGRGLTLQGDRKVIVVGFTFNGKDIDAAIIRFSNLKQNLSFSEPTLLSSYPNPFNANTNIGFQVPKQAFISIKVYGTLGNEIATLLNEEKTPGYYEVTFLPRDLATGVYFIRLQSGSYSETKKILYIR